MNISRTLLVLLLLPFWPGAKGADSSVPSAQKTVEANPRHVRYAMGLSPFLADSVKDNVFRGIVRVILEDLPLDSSLVLYDAYHLRTIGQIEIPNVRAFRSGKTRANQLKEPIQKLKAFLAAREEIPATNGLKLDAAIRLPQFMDFVAENLSEANRPATVIVFGSPFYLDPKEPSFSMVNGYFPSDGHLLATRAQSVFGTKDRAGALRGIEIHFCYFGDPWVSDLHRERIARFWGLFLKTQEAQLATFSSDLPAIFNAARLGSRNGGLEIREARAPLDRSDSKIEMLRITREISLTDWIAGEVPHNVQHSPPSSPVGRMKIGIRWKGKIDLDLYASPRPGGETLFFQHTRSPEGYYFKDFRSSPEREYEFIEFESVVDAREVQAMVNFYDGEAIGGISGEIRIEFEGRLFTGTFSIPSDHGNKGRTGTSQQQYWTQIDVASILLLPKNRTVSRASAAP